MSDAPRLTNRAALLAHRARAEKSPETFLLEEIAVDLQERLEEVNKSFTSPALVAGMAEPFRAFLPGAKVVADGDRLDLSQAGHDLVVHAMALHWADDPVGQLVQSRLALRPDGLFLCACLGGQTLHELRTALAEAESRLSGGLSPRILPMAELRDLGSLLQRAGFSLPVADSRTITVRYPNLHRLVSDLRGMGETNALAQRNTITPPRQLFAVAEDIYRKHFSDADGYLRATFDIVYLTGWAPDGSQPKPLRPGSAKARLADALGVKERPAGDIVIPPKR